MTLQWIRKCSLKVADAKGNGIELSPLRIRFKVTHQTSIPAMPGLLEAQVWNLTQDTVNKIVSYGVPTDKGGFSFTGPQILLQAGYEGNFGTIFKGNVKQIMQGREGPENSYIIMYASDGDNAYTYSTINKTLSRGYAQKDVYTACQDAFKKFGIEPGIVPDKTVETKAVRGRACFGMTREYMDNFSRMNSLDWVFWQNELTTVPQSAYLDGEAVVLDSRSGLIGVPTQSETSINFVCLLNPSIKWGTRVKIDNKALSQYLFDQQPANVAVGGEAIARSPAALNRDGLYKVYFVDHTGDTRGQEWYTEITALGVDQTAPVGATQILGVPPPS